jgi:hypothetical protein
MSDDKQPQIEVSDQSARKAYSSPELKEHGSMAELTQGSGLVVLDLISLSGLVQS